MRVYLLGKDEVGWSIDKDRENVKDFLLKIGVKLVKFLINADIIYCVWYDKLLSKKYYYYLRFLKKIKKIKIIATITNDITIENSNFKALKGLVDFWVAPNNKIYNYLLKCGVKTEIIPFYIKKKIFKKYSMSKEEICKILKLDFELIKNKLLIGSFQRDSLGLDLDKPKWQKNPDLLIKILNNLPKNKYLLILAGPRRHYIIKECEKFGIPYLFYGNKRFILDKKDDIFHNNLSLKLITLLFNLIDLYIVSSKSESGPKAIMEASLTKTLIFSTPVGISPDILDKDLIYEEKEFHKVVNFILGLIDKKIDINQYIQNNYKKTKKLLDDKILLKKYQKVLKNV